MKQRGKEMMWLCVPCSGSVAGGLRSIALLFCCDRGVVVVRREWRVTVEKTLRGDGDGGVFLRFWKSRRALL